MTMLGDLISWLFALLLQWYVWIPLVGILGYLTWKNYKAADYVADTEGTLLVLEIPKTNDKQELAAEQMFASLHGILRDKSELRISRGIQEHVSFEIVAIDKLIRFYVWVPKHLQNFVEGQIYAQYPTVQIREADEDYTKRQFKDTAVIHTAELVVSDNEVLPIKTFQSFEVDPLAGITATLAKLENASEEVWIQVIARPIADDWHRRASRYISDMKGGGPNLDLGGFGYILKLFGALWAPPTETAKSSSPKELSERERTRIAEIEKKSNKLGYQVKIRITYLGNDQITAKLRMQAIVGTFKQFNSTNLNGFKIAKQSFKREDIAPYTSRFFMDRGFILNIEELASVFHLPHTNVETPSIVWATSKTAEPPAKLPIITGDSAHDDQVSAFGLTNFRGMNHQFGIYRSDRSRHVYAIGQTGAGKSGLLELFALSDIYHNHGFAIIDPHGDLAVDVMRFIPSHRIKDVVYFNPADTAYPLGFNPMEVYDPNMKNNISSEIIGVLKRMFEFSWGPRLEYILRYTILALLDHPNTTMLDITRMLTDKKFREEVLASCTDAVVLNFWRIEFASWNEKFAAEAIAPILNKVGAFTANPIIRNIIGQPKSTFNIRELMDNGKILIVNLSKGLIGEDNAAILGAFLVTKIQLAAMSRSDIPRIEDRRAFYLYVDEFQNFATDSFATILSEARKYGLNLTVANQYISQMNETVRDAVFGNVGTMISFRVSADDSPLLSKQFEPQFEPNDLLQMHNRHFIINMVIKGEKAPAFSATTLMLPQAQADYSPYIIDNSRTSYARSREEVQREIQELLTVASRPAGPPQSSSQQRQWPIDRGAKPANRPQQPQQPRSQAAPAAHQQQPSPIDPNAPKKRSRSRSRGRSKGEDTHAPTTTPQAPHHTEITEREVRLR
ncbi:type IV secretion system DNA-binding domain-containing protein [Pedobacter sp.]|nr:type IV secretion system DNA-binding domain-containing protein [Candidatus Saccharibacteria bacterium]